MDAYTYGPGEKQQTAMIRGFNAYCYHVLVLEM